MLRYGRYDKPATVLFNSHKIAKREDISNPFEVLERQTLEVENIVEKNKYLTILFFSQLYTHLHTCQKSHPYGTLLTGDDEVKDRWVRYFDDLLNVENEREDIEGILPV